MEQNTILKIKQLGFPWETQDPFIFCVHHRDEYPKGNDEMGPATSLKGRNIGQDYQRTQFGGWPWPKHEQAHDRNKGRFAIYSDGSEELKP